MEKFCKFIDPMTGINPFLPPKYKKITLKVLIKGLLFIPLWILYKFNVISIRWFIHIKVKRHMRLVKKIFANSVTNFDKEIINSAFDINGIIEFPEKAQTNNLALLSYSGDCDYVVGLKYTNECIYMGGSYFKWLIRFLGTSNIVYVDCARSNNLEQVTGLKTTKFTYKDKEYFDQKFYADVNKY